MSDFDPSHKNVRNGSEIEFMVVANEFSRRVNDPPQIVVFRDKTGYVQARNRVEFDEMFEAL